MSGMQTLQPEQVRSLCYSGRQRMMEKAPKDVLRDKYLVYPFAARLGVHVPLSSRQRILGSGIGSLHNF